MPAVQKVNRLLAARDIDCAQRPLRIAAMMTGNEAFDVAPEVYQKVLLERSYEVFEASPKVLRPVGAQRIGDDAQADEPALEFVQIVVKPAPVATGEQR